MLMNKVLNPYGTVTSSWGADLLALFLPRCCASCDEPLMRFEKGICLTCLEDLPRTRFHDDPRNPVAQLFWGKVQLEAASSLLFFNRTGKAQRMLHRLKYKQDKEVGNLLGRIMAMDLMESTRFASVDRFMAVPLHPRKERMRGFNQSQVLVDGMREVWPLPASDTTLLRAVVTPSQTKKGRLERWHNVKAAFQLPDPEALRDQHVLLVDDVVTTGSTIEACAQVLSAVPGIRISLFTAACA